MAGVPEAYRTRGGFPQVAAGTCRALAHATVTAGSDLPGPWVGEAGRRARYAAAVQPASEQSGADDPRTVRRAALGRLVVPGLVLGIAACATVDSQRAAWFGIEGPQCLVNRVLGPHVCPGCGLTRSTALAVQGRLAEAAAMHAGGIAVALLCLGAIFVHLDVARRGRVLDAHLALRSLGRKALLISVLGAWLWRILGS